ncbi:MAG: hypothetical protein BroJett040_24100 [Oligoflexia bacterium]|nr:MAG: hypothetical protein BroJett040_24100 [Oligoflexia bacterium]
MSLLQKYRKKPDGFIQLVHLIESSEPATQKNLLHLVGTEDPGWAHLIKTKALTPERILGWPPHILQKILLQFSLPLLATLYATSSDETRVAILNAIPEYQIRTVQDHALDHPHDESQALACRLRLVQITRELQAKGNLCFREFDPLLDLDQRLTA